MSITFRICEQRTPSFWNLQHKQLNSSSGTIDSTGSRSLSFGLPNLLHLKNRRASLDVLKCFPSSGFLLMLAGGSPPDAAWLPDFVMSCIPSSLISVFSSAASSNGPSLTYKIISNISHYFLLYSVMYRLTLNC